MPVRGLPAAPRHFDSVIKNKMTFHNLFGSWEYQHSSIPAIELHATYHKHKQAPLLSIFIWWNVENALFW